LPIVNATSLDWELYHLDLALFGFEPAMFMDRFVNPITTEWFAFFYFGYFFLLALHVIPILMFSRQRRLIAEFALGMLIVFCIGHTVYMLVPGYGPYKAMADQFQNEFPRGMWLDMVMTTVTAGGAQKDIFPSLHTAAPTFIALFSFRHRDKLPFRYTWPAVTFFAVNIILATMFLRWHYIIDVVAGLLLACFALVASVRVTRWELTRRTAARLRPSWPLFFDDRARERSVSHRAPAA
jgi:membrane-associated phospholipid phosphatase